VEELGDGDVAGVVRGEIAAEFPDAPQESGVGNPLHGQVSKVLQYLARALLGDGPRGATGFTMTLGAYPPVRSGGGLRERMEVDT
jgi:hypothetical protein